MELRMTHSLLQCVEITKRKRKVSRRNFKYIKHKRGVSPFLLFKQFSHFFTWTNDFRKSNVSSSTSSFIKYYTLTKLTKRYRLKSRNFIVVNIKWSSCMKTIKYLSKFDKNLKILGHRKTIRFKRANKKASNEIIAGRSIGWESLIFK